jgi:glutamine phosphoribosylpyrophosphate amidotransferase
MEAPVRSNVKKKTYNLDSEMIERARRIFHAKTDTEAIRRALEKTIEEQEIEEALDTLLREGRFRTVYR